MVESTASRSSRPPAPQHGPRVDVGREPRRDRRTSRRSATRWSKLGHRIDLLAVEDGHLAVAAAGLRSAGDWIVFNWCEELPGLRRSEPEAAAILERLGFVFTGSPSHVLARSHDKPLIKRILDAGRIPTPPWAVFDEPRAARLGRLPGHRQGGPRALQHRHLPRVGRHVAGRARAPRRLCPARARPARARRGVHRRPRVPRLRVGQREGDRAARRGDGLRRD